MKNHTVAMATAAILDNIANIQIAKTFFLWVNNSLNRSEGRIISPLHFLLIRFFIYVSEKKYSRYCFVPVIALAKKLKTGNNSYSKNILKILINSNRGR